MELVTWFVHWLELYGSPAVISAGILTAIVFIFRNWFLARITKSVQHEYDKDLEKHKEILRKETDSQLMKLRGNVEIEVEKAKLRFNLYSQKQFELYNDLWLKLCELRTSMNDLWQEASREKLWDFQDKLLKAYDVLDQKAILIEQNHYEELRKILKEFVNYQMGKQTLIEMKRNKQNWFDDADIQGLIHSNMESRDKLLKNLEQMMVYLRNQISGNSTGKEK